MIRFQKLRIVIDNDSEKRLILCTKSHNYYRDFLKNDAQFLLLLAQLMAIFENEDHNTENNF